MNFVAVKTAEQQGRGMLFRTRDLLVRQRTQTINALRGHLAEFGVVAAQGPAHVDRLAPALEDPDSDLPDAVRELGSLLLEQIADLEKKIHASARQDADARRLMSVPGIGPITAMAIQAFAPPMEGFRRGRDFAAWLGLVPRQHSTGGKPRLGKISKMGQRDLRRLPITGGMAVVRWAVRRGRTNDPWLARMLARKPRMLVAVALANRMARIVWALIWTRSAHLHEGPRRVTCRNERPDTRQHLTACNQPTEKMLASNGASTHVRREASSRLLPWPVTASVTSRAIALPMGPRASVADRGASIVPGRYAARVPGTGASASEAPWPRSAGCARA